MNERVNSTRNGSPSRGGYRSWMGFGVGLVFLVMIVGFGSFVIALMNSLEEQNGLLNELRTTVEADRKLLTLLESRRLRTVSLLGADNRSSASGTVFWDGENGKGALIVSGLDPPGGNKVYRVWNVDGNRASEVGSFMPGGRNPTYVPLDGIGGADPGILTFLVTLEAETSTGEPAGAMVLVGAPERQGEWKTAKKENQ